MGLLVLDLENQKVWTKSELIDELANALAERLKPVVNDPFIDYPDLLRRKQAMSILGVSATTLWRMVKDPTNELTVHSRVNESPRFLKKDVLDFMKSIKK